MAAEEYQPQIGDRVRVTVVLEGVVVPLSNDAWAVRTPQGTWGPYFPVDATKIEKIDG